MKDRWAAVRKLVHVGIAPRVIALHADTGTVAWESKVPGAGEIVTIRVADGCVYAGSDGEVSCFDAVTGKLLWHNKLKGRGTSVVIFGSEAGAAASQAAADADAAAGAGAAT